MKYAIVVKHPSAWPACVGFASKDERAEQRLRFGYEFPEGAWTDITAIEARGLFPPVRDWRNAPTLPCELCDGRTFEAITTERHYIEIRAAEEDDHAAQDD